MWSGCEGDLLPCSSTSSRKLVSRPVNFPLEPWVWSRPWLKSELDVPMIYPTLSKPRTHLPSAETLPSRKSEPRYSSGAKANVVGSKVPNSQGLISYTVALPSITNSPGLRPSATKTGMGESPDLKVASCAIEEKVYPGPPSMLLTSW